jgi:hypothetical protein
MPPRKRKHLAPDTPLTPVPSEILDQFVGQGPLSVEELDAAVRRFKKAIVERALGGELTHHLGYPPGGVKPEDAANHRNGTSGKTVLTDDGGAGAATRLRPPASPSSDSNGVRGFLPRCPYPCTPVYVRSIRVLFF